MTIVSKMPAQLPSQDRPETLDDDTQNWFQAQAAIAAEMDYTAASMNAAADGNVFALQYVVDTNAADADPGPGFLRFSSGATAQNSSSTLRFDLVGADGRNNTTDLDSFDQSTNPIKGRLRITKNGDPSKWLTFNVLARSAPSGYRNITVVNIGGSSAAPFANGDPVTIRYQIAGDKGDLGFTQTLHIRDEKANGTAAGGSAAGVQTRTLNTTARNTIPGASLSANQFTLPIGTFRIRASAPAYGVGAHKAYLYCVTDAANVSPVGTSEYSPVSGGSVTRSTVWAELPITTAKTYELRHWTQAGVAVNGLGQASSSGFVEVYAEVIIERIA